MNDLKKIAAEMRASGWKYGWKHAEKWADQLEALFAAVHDNPIAPVLVDQAELEALEQCRRLLYGFMLDANAIGITGAAENLTRSIKDAAIAKERGT